MVGSISTKLSRSNQDVNPLLLLTTNPFALKVSLPAAVGPCADGSGGGGDSGFNRVHHIFDKLHGAQLTRLVVYKDHSSNNNRTSHMLTSSLDGTVAVNGLTGDMVDMENKAGPNAFLCKFLGRGPPVDTVLPPVGIWRKSLWLI